MKIQTRSLAKAIGIGLLLAVLIAIPFTAIDWYQNPGGIFRDATGTNYRFVWETFFSWFWPGALVTMPVASGVALWLTHRKNSGT